MTAPSYSVSIYNRRPVRLNYRLIADFSDAVSEMTPCQAQPKAQDAQHQTISAPSQLIDNHQEWLCRNCCNGTPRVNCLWYGHMYDSEYWKATVSDLDYIYEDYIGYDYYDAGNKPDRIERDRIEPEPQYDAALRQADRMASRRAKRRYDMPKYSRRDGSVKRRGRRSLVDGWVVVANIERKYRHVDGFECDCTSATWCTDCIKFDLAASVTESDWN